MSEDPWDDENNYYRELSRRLRIARHTLGLTEKEAAAGACVTVRTWRKWEAGRAVRRYDSLSSFCREFEISVDWMCMFEGPFLKATREEHLVRLYRVRGTLTDAGVPYPGVIVRH
jgi:transcriptional regulator with XRE-family HTH domain